MNAKTNKLVIGAVILLVVIGGIYFFSQSSGGLTVAEIESLADTEIDEYCANLYEEQQNAGPTENVPTCGPRQYDVTESGSDLEVSVLISLSYKGGAKGTRTLNMKFDKEGNILEKDF